MRLFRKPEPKKLEIPQPEVKKEEPKRTSYLDFYKKLHNKVNREPTEEELAKKMHLSLDKVREVIKIAQEPVSL